jgi:hypothetical protein
MVKRLTTHVRHDSSTAERTSAAVELNITLDQLDEMLRFMEIMRVHAEEHQIEPEIAINAATAFLSSAIRCNFDEEGHNAIHIDVATGLLNCVGLTVDPSDVREDTDTQESVH